MTKPPRPTIADVIRWAIRRARDVSGLEQSQLAKRMASLGHPWHPQTVSNVENGKRRVTAEELLGLSLALEAPVSYFLTPWGGRQTDPAVYVVDGNALPASVVQKSVGAGVFKPWVRWIDDEAVWPAASLLQQRQDLDQEMARIQRDIQATSTEEEIHRLLPKFDEVWRRAETLLELAADEDQEDE